MRKSDFGSFDGATFCIYRQTHICNFQSSSCIFYIWSFYNATRFSPQQTHTKNDEYKDLWLRLKILIESFCFHATKTASLSCVVGQNASLPELSSASKNFIAVMRMVVLGMYCLWNRSGTKESQFVHKYERDGGRTKIMHLCRVKLYSHYANIGEQEVVTGKSPYGQRRRSHTQGHWTFRRIHRGVSNVEGIVQINIINC